jgi:ubiquitin-protein ligase
MEAKYKARGLTYHREYTGEEGWSDDETEEEKQSKFVNKLAAKNAYAVLTPPGKANTFREYAPGYQADFKSSGASAPGSTSSRKTPYVPAHVTAMLGGHIRDLIWEEFVTEGVDMASLIRINKLPAIGERVEARLQRSLPFNKLSFPLESDDFVKFADVLSQLVLILSTPSDDFINKAPVAMLPSCCAFEACRKHRGIMGTAGVKKPKDLESAMPFFLEPIYIRWKLMKKGNLRKKHVPAILDEAKIPYEKKRLPPIYWSLYGDQLLETAEDVMEVVEAIRKDMDDERETRDDRFKLPRWLMNEFSVSEIKLFIHHFQSIDIDGGGSIDAEELQKLTESLGNKILLAEAQELIDENDEDGSGTIDFVEFMTLMFRIQHGTIDLENNRLGRAIMESKTQLAILQEIDGIHKSPPFPGLTVGKYGGCPVICDFFVEGPEGTPYEGGSFCLRVKYNSGYPYTCPSVTVATRIFNINVMPKINGDGSLPHLPHMWDCNWNSTRLTRHFRDLMAEQDYSLIPPDIYSIACTYFANESEDKNSIDTSVSSGALRFPDLFAQMARIEQVQINNIILYMGDREQYDSIAKDYTIKFASAPRREDELGDALEGKEDDLDEDELEGIQPRPDFGEAKPETSETYSQQGDAEYEDEWEDADVS